MARKSKVVIAKYEAVGGPPVSGIDDAGNSFGPTDEGKYVVAYCGKHTSPSLYRFWSGIPWGSRLRERNGMVEVFLDGRWQPTTNFTPATKEDIKTMTYDLYKKYIVPDKWLFNDFGHQTCYFFRDVNENFRLDKNEHIHSEFIHTTPKNEAETTKKETVLLEYSHGCIHVKPKDIDEMIAKKYLKKGNLLIIHSYGKDAPIDPVQTGRTPFEVHFYPRSNQILIFGAR